MHCFYDSLPSLYPKQSATSNCIANCNFAFVLDD